MIKKIVYIALALGLLAYLVLSMVQASSYMPVETCKEVDIVIADTSDRHFISSQHVLSMLKQAGLYPQGKQLSQVDTEAIEQLLEKNKVIKQVHVFKTINGKVVVKVFQKKPVCRVMSVYGDFYLDEEAQWMPVSAQYSANVPLLTGYVNKNDIPADLFALVQYISAHSLWSVQIEQIHLRPNQHIELVPRVGDQVIVLGKIDNFEEKLDKLSLLYNKVLSQVGWNKYSTINLSFKNQVVCTKK